MIPGSRLGPYENQAMTADERDVTVNVETLAGLQPPRLIATDKWTGHEDYSRGSLVYGSSGEPAASTIPRIVTYEGVVGTVSQLREPD